MRHCLFGFLFLCVAVISIAGFRGSHSRKPPIEIFPDMDRQPKLRPQARDSFFSDRLSSRPSVAGTLARGTPYEDKPENTGRIPGTTNDVDTIPVPVTIELLQRGQEQFTTYCALCHGAAGDGTGITAKLGMVTIGDLHDRTIRKVVQMPDGQLFRTITEGKNLMNGYAATLSILDRWAVVAYVRALQRSRLATLDDVPEPMRAHLRD